MESERERGLPSRLLLFSVPGLVGLRLVLLPVPPRRGAATATVGTSCRPSSCVIVRSTAATKREDGPELGHQGRPFSLQGMEQLQSLRGCPENWRRGRNLARIVHSSLYRGGTGVTGPKAGQLQRQSCSLGLLSQPGALPAFPGVPSSEWGPARRGAARG